MTTDIPCWQAWCDGTAAPNPGRIGIGVLLVSPDGERHELARALGRSGCNNEAEVCAICSALDLATSVGVRRLTIHCDSRFAVDCLTGRDHTEIPRLALLLATTRECMAGFEAVTLVWLPRHRNTEADRLARQSFGLPPKPPPRPKKRRR